VSTTGPEGAPEGAKTETSTEHVNVQQTAATVANSAAPAPEHVTAATLHVSAANVTSTITPAATLVKPATVATVAASVPPVKAATTEPNPIGAAPVGELYDLIAAKAKGAREIRLGNTAYEQLQTDIGVKFDRIPVGGNKVYHGSWDFGYGRRVPLTRDRTLAPTAWHVA
jgi:hypothetical protein